MTMTYTISFDSFEWMNCISVSVGPELLRSTVSRRNRAWWSAPPYRWHWRGQIWKRTARPFTTLHPVYFHLHREDANCFQCICRLRCARNVIQCSLFRTRNERVRHSMLEHSLDNATYANSIPFIDAIDNGQAKHLTYIGKSVMIMFGYSFVLHTHTHTFIVMIEHSHSHTSIESGEQFDGKVLD